MIRNVTLHSRTEEFCGGHHITSRFQKYRLKATLKYIKSLIKNQNFLMDDLDKGDILTPFMYV